MNLRLIRPNIFPHNILVVKGREDIRNEPSVRNSTCAYKAQCQDCSIAFVFVIPLKIQMQYVKYVKMNWQDRSDCQFKPEELKDLCWFCILHSIVVDVFGWIKDTHCGDMLMDVYTKTFRVFVLVNDNPFWSDTIERHA